MRPLYRPRARHLFGALIGAALMLSACSADDPDTVVEICGNLSVPGELDSLRVVVTDQDGRILREGVRELWTCPGPSLMPLPQTLEFAPVEGDVFIKTQGIKDGVPIIENTLRKTLGPGDHRATLSLEQGCVGLRCAPGETCSQGACELIALASESVSSCTGLSTYDDAIADAGESTPDAGGSEETPGAYLCPQPDAGSLEDSDADEGS